MYICIYVCVCIYIYIYKYKYTYTYICTYTHTHTCTRTYEFFTNTVYVGFQDTDVVQLNPTPERLAERRKVLLEARAAEKASAKANRTDDDKRKGDVSASFI